MIVLDTYYIRRFRDIMVYNTEFVNRKMKKWSKYIIDFDLPTYNELPSIGLYMDQVITLLGQYLGYLPYYESKAADSFITANAINNYVRLGAMPAPVKKKYYKSHIAYLIMICVLKPSLSISDISALIPNDISEDQLIVLYTRFREIHKASSVKLIDHLTEISGSPSSDDDVNELIITSAVTTSLCKRFTEKTSALKGIPDEAAEQELRARLK